MRRPGPNSKRRFTIAPFSSTIIMASFKHYSSLSSIGNRAMPERCREPESGGTSTKPSPKTERFVDRYTTVYFPHLVATPILKMRDGLPTLESLLHPSLVPIRSNFAFLRSLHIAPKFHYWLHCLHYSCY